MTAAAAGSWGQCGEDTRAIADTSAWEAWAGEECDQTKSRAVRCVGSLGEGAAPGTLQDEVLSELGEILN